MIDGPISIATDLIESWLHGGKSLRYTLGLAIFFVLIAMLLVVIGHVTNEKQLTEIIAGTLGVISAILAMGVVAYQRVLELTKRQKRIEAVEERYKKNPQETQAAWELARTKLESYLNRNLSQVYSIFWLTLFVMFFGFGLIGFGIYHVYDSPDAFKPSIVAACSGILVNFIGATFMVIYKSTMKQAQEYMGVLERINAVGMSVQILENLKESSHDLKEKTTAELAKQLLILYTKENKK